MGADILEVHALHRSNKQQKQHFSCNCTMAESALILPGTVLTLDVPSSAVQRKTGFSMDFGSSSIKIAYALEVEGKVRLHFVSYPRDRIDEAFEHIKVAMGSHLSPGQHVFLTGVGCNQHKEKIEKELGIQFTLSFETDTHMAGFLFLVKNCQMKDILHPHSKAVQTYAWSGAQSMMDTFKSLADISAAKAIEPHTRKLQKPEGLEIPPEKIEFPALLFMIGSDAMPMLVHEDGSYDLFDHNPAGGRCLLGCGSLTAESKTFEELVNLAENGDSSNLNQLMGDMLEKEAKDVYTDGCVMDDDLPLFSFGHAVGKDRGEFSREDRAVAVISLAASNLAVYCQMWAMFFRAKHVYFIGGLHTSSQLVREELGKHFAYRSLMSYTGVYTQHHFVKLGAYLGALGTLMQNLGSEQ